MVETRIFDGLEKAREAEAVLAQKVRELSVAPRLCSLVFDQDEASQLYTRLKFEAALRTGIEFDSIHDVIVQDKQLLKEAVARASSREDVHGVMIQKPMKRFFFEQTGRKGSLIYDLWWRELTSAIDPKKDVDCLTRTNLDLVYAHQWWILPATVTAVLTILQEALGLTHSLTDRTAAKAGVLNGLKAVVIGRSELVGKPLAAVLEYWGAETQITDSRTEQLAQKTSEADILVSATGVRYLVEAEMIKPGAVVIDVGAPGSDVRLKAALGKAGFVTPVPNGVGPMTVVSLLENVVELVKEG